MAAITDAKSWSLTCLIAPDTSLSFLDQAGTPTSLEAFNPVQLLLSAAAGCLAKVCASLVEANQLPAYPITVAITGHKPAGPLPGKGLNAMDVTVTFDAQAQASGLDYSKAQALVAKAKTLCTVTNTLSPAVTFAVSVTPF